ncbi:MAG: lipopolysaccharide biosynthesis protein [Bacteroidaceae bacterium]|nr:lipopolysaccharide biosynthesis protein [Bacteroidaceae bacterium]
MSAHSENTKRIAKNTMMLYLRMLFSMVVSLYTSRVVLNTLGVEDYGIQNAVGGFVAMFSIFSNSLSSAVSRFLTFELGKGDTENLKKVFSTALLVHLGLTLIVLVIAETIGVWFVNHRMNIPADRMYAANWVFQASIISFCFSLLSAPYRATITSHEHLSMFAYIGIADSCLHLASVLFIAYSSLQFDRLIAYSILLVGINVVLQCVYTIYCGIHFDECSLHNKWSKRYIKEITSFTSWNFIGCTADLLKDQGINILLNITFGPIINAARGIAYTVNRAVIGFASNFMTALSPQITKNYASGDKEYSFSLVERGSRFCFYIMFILSLPLCLEADTILAIWLKQYPDHTVNFVRLVLVLSLSEILSSTLIYLQLATGKIRKYQLIIGSITLLNFPLSYIALKLGYPPESPLAIAIVISISCMMIRLILLKKTAGLSISSFIKHVYINIICVAILSSIIPLVLHFIMNEGWLRMIVTCSTSVIASCLIILFVGCSYNERAFIFSKIPIIKHQFKHP